MDGDLIWHYQLQISTSMNAIQARPHISKEVFEALLLIYASYSDLHFSHEERENIEHSFGKDVFLSASQLYKNCREYELLKNICDLRQLYYPGHEGKTQILDLLRHHFHLDGDFSRLERTQYNFLRMML